MSYFKSLMSNGIVIANTNKNLENECNIKSVDNKILFSSAKISVVLNAQTSEIINIFNIGICLSTVG
ncbi:MAG: hypothetical protein P8N46_03355 [Flavobacteriales bacterium]|nr:hypothetical protein [Flavobacteriales bacterium]